MAKRLANLDLVQNELQNARIQNLGSAPGSPVSGQIYYDTGSGTLQLRNASAFFGVIDGGAVSQTKTGQLTLTGGLVVNTTGITGNQGIVLTGTGASSVAGTFAATAHVGSGLTGAVAASRYVGATASGAPVSGTFAVGDFTISQGGDIYVCTGAGTPGTWVRVGSYLLGTNNTWSGTNTFNAAVSGSGSITMTSTVQGTAIIASGLTGATSASRYVGATASAAPGSGTFVTGDFVIAQSGTIFICTAGGSPGTWAQVSGSAGYTTVQDSGSGVTQRSIINFIDGTGTTATAVDNASKTDVSFSVTFGNVTAQTTFGAASGNGAATTSSRSDHVHGTPTHDGAAHSAVSHSALSAPTADIAWGGFKITNLGAPSAATDAATKGYVDGVATGLDVKASVRAASTATVGTYNSTAGTSARGQLTAAPNTLDGVTLAASDRILVKNHSTPAANGIYVISTLGTGANGVWDRATDFDADAEVTTGAFTFVSEGTVNADTGWVLTTNDAIVIGGAGGTSLTFAQFSGAGAITAGSGLTQSGTTINVGAGTGITVNADDVAINTAVVVRKYAVAIGDGSTVNHVVTHNLGTQDVTVAVYLNSGTFEEVLTDIEHTSTNTITVRFAVAPTSNQYRVVVHA